MSNKTEYAYYFDLAVPEKFSAEKESIMVRTESTGILEKYSKFLAKEEEVKEKQEKTRRLRDRLSLSLRIKNTQRNMRELKSPSVESHNSARNGSISPTQVRRNILKSRNELFTRTWSSKEIRQQQKLGDLSMEELQQLIDSKVHSVPNTPSKEAPVALTFVEPIPEGHKLDSNAVSLILEKKKKEADAKRNKRAKKIRSLERDCFRAQRIIEQMKSVSSTSTKLDYDDKN